MGLAGVTWFAGSFWPGLLFLHRGPLVHLHLSYPTGPSALVARRGDRRRQLRRRDLRAARPQRHRDASRSPCSSPASPRAASSVPRERLAVRTVPALFAALAFAGVLGARRASTGSPAGTPTPAVLWAYDVAVAGAVILLLVDLLRGRWADAVVTDLVVDLGSRADTGTLRDALGRALGDPSLVLGYWLSDEARYVDDAGRPVDIAQPGPGRVVTADRTRRSPGRGARARRRRPPGPRARRRRRRRGPARRVQRPPAGRHSGTGASSSPRRDVGSSRPATPNGNTSSGICATGSSAGCRRWPHSSRVSATTSTDRPASLLDELDEELDRTRAELDDLARGIHPRALTERRARRSARRAHDALATAGQTHRH